MIPIIFERIYKIYTTTILLFRKIDSIHIGILLSLLLLVSCGYKPTYMVSSIFPSHDSRIGIRNIINPTLSTQLPYHFRSALYNTITNRKIGIWRMDPPMDYEMEIKVINYRVTPRTVIEDDVVLLYLASITVAVTIYDYHTGKEFWSSGHIVTEHTYNTFADEIILPHLLGLSTNDIVNAMQVVF